MLLEQRITKYICTFGRFQVLYIFYSYTVDMYFYEVAVTTNTYHGKDLLTYSSNDQLKIGTIVLVPVRSKDSSAVVIKEVKKPAFNTKGVIRVLTERPIPKDSIAFMRWLQGYYPSTLSVAASQIISTNLSLKKDNQAVTFEPHSQKIVEAPKLTQEQQQAYDEMVRGEKSSFILHGDTGTGKTRVYIELAKKVLGDGKNVIILTPEIGLTSQLASSIKSHLSNNVIVLHSNLTPRERRIIWLGCLYSDKPIIIIGPRSALFAPLSNIGLVVIDEFHDAAYKQEQAPYYNALRVAASLANIHHALLVYGSATPPVTEYYFAERKLISILRMQKTAKNQTTKTETKIVNARDRSLYVKDPFLSDTLLATIKIALANKEQSLVFLNRRGTARIVMCQDCDWQSLCPRCDLPLTYHGDSHSIRCHTCGYKDKTPLSCPECNSNEILFKSIGTKSIEQQLKKIFPDARVQRFDTDNTKAEAFAQHYNNVVKGNVDILVGTQLLVKGLDLPKLSVVGVVAADSSLYFPDYTAEEQTYQILSQVIGRVARGHRSGTVIVQTYNPDGAAQKAALTKNWDVFYKQQLKERSEFLFPPFCFILKISCSRKSQNAAMEAILKTKRIIEGLAVKAAIIGPAPRFNERAQGMYQWQLIVKSKSRIDLLSIIEHLPANTHYDIDPSNLL